MNRKADLRLWIIPLILALLVLAAGLGGFWKLFAPFVWGAKLLGFNVTSEAEGTTILGVNLETQELAYFTGDAWRKIDLSDKIFVLGGYEFVPQTAFNDFKTFYEVQRRPPNRITFDTEANLWRYWNVGLSTDGWGSMRVVTNTKNGFAGPTKETNIRGTIRGDNVLSHQAGPANLKFLPEEMSSSAFVAAIAWRDQIIEGRECEKHLPLEVSVDIQASPGPKITNRYTVQKLDEYLFIDLDKPVLDGTVEEWKNESCYNKLVAYTDQDRSDWQNFATVELYYVEKDGDNGDEKVWWQPTKGWVYQSHDTGFQEVVLQNALSNHVYKLTLEKNSFTAGERNYLLLDDSKVINSVDTSKPAGSNTKEAVSFYFELLPRTYVQGGSTITTSQYDLYLLYHKADAPYDTGQGSYNDGRRGAVGKVYDPSDPNKVLTSEEILTKGVLNVYSTYTSDSLLQKINGKRTQEILAGVNIPNLDLSTTQYKKDSRVPAIFYERLAGKNVYDGLVELTKLDGILQKQDAEFDKDFMGAFVHSAAGAKTTIDITPVKNGEWGDWAEEKDKKISVFVYRLLDQYNKNLQVPLGGS